MSTTRMQKTMILIPLFLIILSAVAQEQQANVHFSINEPCNVRIWDAAGKYYRPDSIYFWKNFMKQPFPDFPCDGKFAVRLAPGLYKYELDRGPEYYLTKGDLTVGIDDIHLELKLKRLVDLEKMNWWPGELHVHRKVKDIEFLMKASDIYIAPVITSWNENYPYTRQDTSYDFSTKSFDGNRYYTTTGSEDERSGGAILTLNTSNAINYNKKYTSEYPPLAASVMDAAKNYKDSVWIDIDKPFWWDVPVLLATGKVNSVGIAHNHMDQNGVFDNEAWGKARDKNKYPFPMGNGYWTQDVFYQILNSGIKIIPSAGSASGVLLNPLGYNREYVYVENGLTYDKWFRALKEGRCFVTNGPLLVCGADGQLPGHVFSANKKTTVNISGQVMSRDSIASVDIIKNGKIYKTIPGAQLKDGQFSLPVAFDKSGWFLVRVMCSVPGNFRFASTAPFYVEVGKNKQFISRASARFFLDWVNERSSVIKAGNDQELREINEYINAARIFWQDKVSKATDE
jgi:hypothetical protein